MTDRERLVELIEKARAAMKKEELSCDLARNFFFAEYLLNNGVMVLPCNVGDTVYQHDTVKIYPSTIRKLIFDTENIAFDETAIGESIFLTREEAEAALAERE